jgi:hypothetical protein
MFRTEVVQAFACYVVFVWRVHCVPFTVVVVQTDHARCIAVMWLSPAIRELQYAMNCSTFGKAEAIS